MLARLTGAVQWSTGKLRIAHSYGHVTQAVKTGNEPINILIKPTNTMHHAVHVPAMLVQQLA